MTTSWTGPSVSARTPAVVTLPERSTAGARSETPVARLRALAIRLSSFGSLDEILNDIADFASETGKCDFCGVYLVDGDSLIRRAGQQPHPEALQKVKLHPVMEATRWASSPEPAAANQRAWSDAGAKLFFTEPLGMRFESFVSVPVVGGGHVVGAINMIWRDAHTPDARDMEFLAALGVLAGAEVERARLAAENAHLTEKLETRKVVERAKGILQRNLNLTEEDAYLTLQRESRQRRKSMKEVAEAIVLSEELKKKK